MTIYSVIMLTFHVTTHFQAMVPGTNNLLPLLFPYYLVAMKNATGESRAGARGVKRRRASPF